MVLVTSSKPRELEKMSEEKRVKETPASTAPKPEIQTVRVEWQGLQAGASSDVPFYKPNQRRSGEVQQGVQPVPAIWLPSPHGSPWQHNNIVENSLANGHAATSPPLGWYGSKQVFACSGVIILLLVLLSYLDRYRLLARFRPRRSKVQNTLKVVCQLRDDTSDPKLPMQLNDFVNVLDKPPSYSKHPESLDNVTSKVDKTNENDICTCVLNTGKNQVPRVLFYDVGQDLKAMERLGFKSTGQANMSQHMQINVPTRVTINDPRKERANFVIEINDTATESGCVIGMDVLVDRNSNDTIIFEERNDLPFSVIVEKLVPVDNAKDNKKNDEAAKK